MNTFAKFALLLSAALAAPLAHADKNITFNVPVKVEKMDPLVSTVVVMCNIRSEQNNESLAGSSNSATVSGGAYQGTLAVAVTVPDAKLGLAKKWKCTLRLGATGYDGLSLANNPNHHWAKVNPGAVTEHEGNF